jgi:hypothetical protein
MVGKSIFNHRQASVASFSIVPEEKTVNNISVPK